MLLGAAVVLGAMVGLDHAARADDDGWAARVAAAPQALFAPAYDVATQASMRGLATTLRSYEVANGSLDGLTPEDLVAWGWTVPETMAVTVTVDGHDFCVVARDVRPGGSTFHVASTSGAAGSALAAGVHAGDDHEPLAAEPGLQVVRAAPGR
ncbi:hypothetical protein [Cellulomonas carbonis]|uniref:hypothetical protein n=1 Tax=Cellulomonas carbonis TaxID=1386092 RepID=UPI00126A725F|nr:hypothetical protein [Cellulomonas carbonis]